MSRNAQAEKEKQARVTLASAEVAIAQQISEASHIYAHNPVALQIRQMGLIYDMNKDRGVTILVPTDMANALGASIALNVNNPDFPPPRTSPFYPVHPAAGVCPPGVKPSLGRLPSLIQAGRACRHD